MRHIKLLADYYCFPTWDVSPGTYDDIDPHELPISAALIAELMRWSDEYDATLDKDDPKNSGFESLSAELAFLQRGEELASRLKQELGKGYTVTYRQTLEGRWTNANSRQSGDNV